MISNQTAEPAEKPIKLAYGQKGRKLPKKEPRARKRSAQLDRNFHLPVRRFPGKQKIFEETNKMSKNVRISADHDRSDRGEAIRAN